MVLAASAFIVAAVLSSAWITGQFTTPAVDRTDGYVSELAARNQPWTRLFRVSEVLSGLSCVFGVALVPRVAREWPGWLALAAFGLLTFAAGLFPLDCAALSDPACGRAGTSFAHRMHTLAGPLGTVAVLAAMVVLSLRWRSWVSWLFTWLSLAATLLTVAAHADRHGVGIAHRAQLTLIAVWLVYVAVHLLISDDDDHDHHQAAWDEPAITVNGTTGAGTWNSVAGGADGYGRPHVVEQGAGPAVLITAGPGGAWFHWDRVAGHLAGGRRRVIRFDRPGLGLSPRSPAPPTLYAEVARLAGLSPAHPERVTVLAHGVACWHAEAFARLHPLCVAGLVLVDPACAVRRRRLALGGSAGQWLPALGGTWGATALARLAGPAAHRLLTGEPDPSGAYSLGKVPLAVAGEWLARRDMAADLRLLRGEKPLPGVPVIVVSTGARDPCRQRLATMLGARLVRLPVSRRQVHLKAPEAIAEMVSAIPARGPGPSHRNP
ncbi:Pimeloyl-ACP methyl ester carboxylesterase [Nonomuraea jiangxiensis]|uniref:Pimeloyl-ACP methyl ester carboxylesterase n=1 Tax=Nonomuraea jiangxiensis TaxID=633440 RepID=A0A1G8R9E1_9ACTN|nr:Pimeloyl-ACP methyl ester carboxylesterase [Nonomuraea jiangxiensis]